MAQKLKAGDHVYVPARLFPETEANLFALFRTKIMSIAGNKVVVDVPKNPNPSSIGKSLIHKELGILILNLGDFSSETGLLDPLAKSVHQYCKLILPDDNLRSIRIRTTKELQEFWTNYHKLYSHIIIIAHGSNTGIKVGIDGNKTAAELNQVFRRWGSERKVLISLACQTGYKAVAGELSAQAIWKTVIAPYHSVHGAVASQFCQTLLASHLIEGKSIGVAFNHAKQATPGKTSFKLWQANQLKHE